MPLPVLQPHGAPCPQSSGWIPAITPQIPGDPGLENGNKTERGVEKGAVSEAQAGIRTHWFAPQKTAFCFVSGFLLSKQL